MSSESGSDSDSDESTQPAQVYNEDEWNSIPAIKVKKLRNKLKSLYDGFEDINNYPSDITQMWVSIIQYEQSVRGSAPPGWINSVALYAISEKECTIKTAKLNKRIQDLNQDLKILKKESSTLKKAIQQSGYIQDISKNIQDQNILDEAVSDRAVKRIKSGRGRQTTGKRKKKKTKRKPKRKPKRTSNFF